MTGLEEILEGFTSNVITLLLIAAAIGFAVMYLVSKLTGSVRVGSVTAGAVLLLCGYWLAREGILIDYLSSI